MAVNKSVKVVGKAAKGDGNIVPKNTGCEMVDSLKGDWWMVDGGWCG